MGTTSDLDGVVLRIFANGTYSTSKFLPTVASRWGQLGELGATNGLDSDMIPSR